MDNLQAQFEQVKKKYIEKLPDKLLQIKAVEEKLLSDGTNIDNLNELRLLAHSICGSSGMFGISLLSECAYNLEIYLKQCTKEEPLSCDINKVTTLLGEMRNSFNCICGE